MRRLAGLPAAGGRAVSRLTSGRRLTSRARSCCAGRWLACSRSAGDRRFLHGERRSARDHRHRRAHRRAAHRHRRASGRCRPRDYASTRYSELAQITPANAKNLHAAWTFSTGVLRGHEGQPLVVGNTMYLVTPYPNVVVRARPRRSRACRSSGSTVRRTRRRRSGIACCDVVNRGAAYADGKIFYNLLDGHTVAVDAATGKQLWRDEDGRPRHAARRSRWRRSS